MNCIWSTPGVPSENLFLFSSFLTQKTSYRYLVRTGRKRPSYNKDNALQVVPGAKSYNYVIDLESDERQRSANVPGNGDYSGTDYTTTLLKNNAGKNGTLSQAYKGTKSRNSVEINTKKENDKQEKQVKKETHTTTGEGNKIHKNDKQGEKRTKNTRDRKSKVPKNTEIKEMTKEQSSKKGGEHYQESEKNPKENRMKKTRNHEQMKEKRGKDGKENIRGKGKKQQTKRHRHGDH